MQKLLLTSPEKALFDALPAPLREGWVCELIADIPPDDPVQRVMRMHLMRLHSPSLLHFRESIAQNVDTESLAQRVIAADLSDVTHEDLIELFFAMGPEVLSHVIEGFLAQVSTDEDLETIAGMTALRDAQRVSKKTS